jgi:hypothetical protein
MDSRRRLISRRCIHEAGGRPKRSRQAFTQAVVRLRLRLLIRDAHLPSLRGDPSPPPPFLSLSYSRTEHSKLHSCLADDRVVLETRRVTFRGTDLSLIPRLIEVWLRHLYVIRQTDRSDKRRYEQREFEQPKQAASR